MRVLVVDDSVVFRSQIKSALDGVGLIEVVGVANNGKVAIQKLSQMSVDLITLDMEMPEMGGLETIREIRKQKFKVRIIVFSSHTTRGSEAALEALAAGADDFIAKPSGPDVNIENAAEKIRKGLLPKVLQFVDSEKMRTVQPGVVSASGSSQASSNLTAGSAAPLPVHLRKKEISTFFPNVVVVGSSTGGPPALEKILIGLPKPMRVPILITQHMPPMFTASLAKRLEMVSGISAAEGVDGEEVLPNRIYVAPGDHHMTLVKKNDKVCIKLDQSPQRNSVRPAVDPLFETASEIYGSKVLSIVLTGMGEDGLVGAKAVKSAGGGVVIQDKASCVVFGMPGAIFNANVYDEIAGLEKINTQLKRIMA